MQSALRSSITVAVAVAAVFALRPSPAEIGEERPGGRASLDDPVVTLWAKDAPRASFDFVRGEYGGRIEDGQFLLDGAQVAYDVLEKERLSFGFSFNQSALLVDLGDIRVPKVSNSHDRGPKLDLSLYHTLGLRRGRFVYKGPFNKSYDQSDARKILRSHPRLGVQHVEPQLGHVYLLRFRPNYRRRKTEYLLKFQIVDLEPGRRLSFRWASL